jgi:flagellum-specific peptidoglycan hydrolase FlgJ
MANSQKAAFFEQYAPLAMEQQQKYGIPASVTLAQMYLESAGGTSNLAVTGNNYFGIKCSSQWLADGKPYSLHHDDKPNEKFCNYASVQESIEHHSQFLMGSRYAACRRCAADDYRGWANGLQAAGYATNRNYANTLIADIEAYGLSKYDRQAMTMPKVADQQTVTLSAPSQAYSFPVAGDSLMMTDGYGISPTSYRNHAHNGIDLKARYEDVMATENQGRVVKVGNDKTSGNFAVVEYDRSDGAKWRVSYCHLDSVAVRQGDVVNAGQKLGVSGNTGNSTGPHLHLTVRHQAAGSTEFKTVDPLNYLAEIAVRGNLTATVVKKGTNADLLASRKGGVDLSPTQADRLMAQPQLTPQQQQNAQAGAQLAQRTGSNDPNTLLAYLMGQNNDDQTAYGQHGDIFSSLISGLFTSAIGMAIMLDQADQGEERTTSQVANESVQETEQQKAATLIQRKRDSVDPVQARETAMMNFDAEYPEQQQNTGQRLA